MLILSIKVFLPGTLTVRQLSSNKQPRVPLLAPHCGHARARTPAARARQATKMLNEEVAGLVSGLRSTSGSSLAAFGRMEERVLALEAEAEASSQLGGVRAPECPANDAQYEVFPPSQKTGLDG